MSPMSLPILLPPVPRVPIWSIAFATFLLSKLLDDLIDLVATSVMSLATDTDSIAASFIRVVAPGRVVFGSAKPIAFSSGFASVGGWVIFRRAASFHACSPLSIKFLSHVICSVAVSKSCLPKAMAASLDLCWTSLNTGNFACSNEYFSPSFFSVSLNSCSVCPERLALLMIFCSWASFIDLPN